MQRFTALKNAKLIAERLRALSGIICTPNGRHSGVRIRRAWIFGSTAKGAERPNDLDILLDIQIIGPAKTRDIKQKQRGGTPTRDKDLYRMGIDVPMSSETLAVLPLRKNMKMVRLHYLRFDGSIAYPRVMIYPRNDL